MLLDWICAAVVCEVQISVIPHQWRSTSPSPQLVKRCIGAHRKLACGEALHQSLCVCLHVPLSAIFRCHVTLLLQTEPSSTHCQNKGLILSNRCWIHPPTHTHTHTHPLTMNPSLYFHTTQAQCHKLHLTWSCCQGKPRVTLSKTSLRMPGVKCRSRTHADWWTKQREVDCRVSTAAFRPLRLWCSDMTVFFHHWRNKHSKPSLHTTYTNDEKYN